MNAYEACIATEAALVKLKKEEIELVENCIEKACNEGEFSIEIYTRFDETDSYFENLGFYISHYNTAGTIISWKKSANSSQF